MLFNDMQEFVRDLSSVIVLGALVAIFVALQFRHSSRRIRWWLVGWGLIFLHVVATLLPLGPGAKQLATFLDIATLQIAGIAFVTSVGGFEELHGPARFIGYYHAALLTVFSGLVACDVRSPWLYVVCLALFFYSGAALGFTHHKAGGLLWRLIPAITVVFATFALYRVARGDVQFGCYAALLLSYSITAMLFWRHYRRLTPGVLATCGGFVGWAALFALAAFAPQAMDWIGRQSELWDVPKIIVAIGMILVLLEDESQASRAAREREHEAKLQIQSFAEVTSRLLSGADAMALCGHIARVITETTTFERVLIGLASDAHQIQIAGHSGLAENELESLRSLAVRTSPAAIADLCRQGRKVGNTAVICTAEQSRPYAAARSTRHYVANPQWQDGDELIVPLRSPRGVFVGFISLDDPRDPLRVTAEELYKIEMLAADIAVAADHAALQRQLLTTEKLAGLGQLVGGFAHELNNPLTAVLGYSELLADRQMDEDARRGLATIHREGQRMKRIISNLLSFAQRDVTRTNPVDLLPIVQEVVLQKSYEVRERGIEIVADISPLPVVMADENQIRQVFLNVLSNAIEAVDKAKTKRIAVSARADGERVVVAFQDTGPGFSDVHRVFDPFFTTKSPGKGAGLGLSICYGVLRQHGGTVSARNVEPTGACITLELPIAKQAAAGAV